ncbi:WAT1-related protein At2g39510-like [Corylus avellana]|uniref:WAT1-related protein At2g39510-like n=1 Tax=Corylus avellana TaxID=13451 RepID=UPI00286AC0DE|nr:WAT1-related protein At2g39510-like [Corylus avellana]
MPLESLRRLFCRVKLYLAVIFLQFGYAGMSIIAKYALDQGMSHFVFIAYRMAIASVVITPFAIVLERTSRPRMTLSIFVKAMLLSFFDPLLDQNLLFIGMTYTNASFTSAMCNTIPAFAFSMAWVFGLEQVNTRRLHSKAKIIGTLVAVGGAMFMTLFKGSVINPPWTNGRNPHDHPSARPASKENVMKGALLVLGSCFFWSSFMILHAFTLRSYPAKLSLTALICMSATVECTIVALAFERGNAAVWSIHRDAKLLACLYAGILSGISYYIMGVVIRARGPVFFSAFSPLSTVVVAIVGSFVLAEEMYLGRIIGAVIIVIGLYFVLWGKRVDQPASTGTAAPNEEQTATFTENMGTANRVFVDVSSVVPTNEHD